MGYTTGFSGAFSITPALTDEHANYLRLFADTRRMKRDESCIDEWSLHTSDGWTHEKIGLETGVEGGYFVDGGGSFGQDQEESVTNYNSPPAGQPDLWCQWTPNEDGTELEWDGGEKFYNYVEWLEYLIAHFFNRWGYTLNGCVRWSGEDTDDVGTLVVEDNVVNTRYGEILHDVEELGPAEQDEDLEEDDVDVIGKIERLKVVKADIMALDKQEAELASLRKNLETEFRDLVSELGTVYNTLSDILSE